MLRQLNIATITHEANKMRNQIIADKQKCHNASHKTHKQANPLHFIIKRC